METLELVQLEMIDYRLSQVKEKFKEVSWDWKRINSERLQLDHEIKCLMTARADIAQGQLFLDI